MRGRERREKERKRRGGTASDGRVANPARVGLGRTPPRRTAMMEGSAGTIQAPDRRTRWVATPPVRWGHPRRCGLGTERRGPCRGLAVMRTSGPPYIVFVPRWRGRRQASTLHREQRRRHKLQFIANLGRWFRFVYGIGSLCAPLCG
ncbi:hypothetical protein VPH35_073138 [Triticum aestivum]